MTDGSYLLMKRGLYWRFKSAGYTGIKEEAERYSAEEVAARRADVVIDSVDQAPRGDHENVYAIREADAPAYLETCFSDILAGHASATVERLTRERDAAIAAAPKVDDGSIEKVAMAIGRENGSAWALRDEPDEQDVHVRSDAEEPSPPTGGGGPPSHRRSIPHHS